MTSGAAAVVSAEPATLCFIISLPALSSHIVSFYTQAHSLTLPEN